MATELLTRPALRGLLATPAPPRTVIVGEMLLSYVADGYIRMRPEEFFSGGDEDVWDRHRALLDDEGHLVMSMGAWLLRGRGHVTLIDLGLGPRTVSLTAPGGGRTAGEMAGGALLDNLARVGISPGEVDTVLISHLHDEHLGWITDELRRGEMTFANAVHHVGAIEWTDITARAGARAPAVPSPEQIALLRADGRLLVHGDQPVPGVTVWETPGHTPGHLSFVVRSHGKRVVIAGDVLHSPVELDEAGLTFAGDADPLQAAETREWLLDELAAPYTTTAAGHFPMTTVGIFRPGSSAPRWAAMTECALA